MYLDIRFENGGESRKIIMMKFMEDGKQITSYGGESEIDSLVNQLRFTTEGGQHEATGRCDGGKRTERAKKKKLFNLPWKSPSQDRYSEEFVLVQFFCSLSHFRCSSTMWFSTVQYHTIIR